MPINAAHWSIDRATGNIRYIGDDHVRFGGSTPSYASVIEFHRWLQDLADDASSTGNDELDITDSTPSERATDNYVKLINGYNIDDNAAEHLYDGSIEQAGGAEIYDGFVNFGNPNVIIQIIQNGAVLADDWWNTTTGGLNADAAAGISHRFLLKVRTGGTDIDGRRLIGTARRYGFTFREFKVNGTSRGNNTLALSDASDLNNTTASGTVAGWTTITNLTEGYVHIDVNNDGTPDEYFYSEWNRDTYSINQFYERMKYLTRDGSTETLYGLNGELFRGITHKIPYTGLTGTFDEANPITWSGTNSGTGQVLADDGVGNVWIQLLTGLAPASGDTLSQTVPDAASATAGTVEEQTVSTPFCGVSTGSALISAYGFSLEFADLSTNDRLLALDGNTYQPPNVVQFSVAGLVVGEDRVLVGPESGGSLLTNQFTLSVTLTGGTNGQATVGTAIPADTPSSGTIRIQTDSGVYRRVAYSSWSGSVFTFAANEDFTADPATSGNEVFISYIDKLAASTSESFSAVYVSPRSLFIRVRDGGTAGDAEGIKTFETTGVLGSSGGSTTAIRTPDV